MSTMSFQLAFSKFGVYFCAEGQRGVQLGIQVRARGRLSGSRVTSLATHMETQYPQPSRNIIQHLHIHVVWAGYTRSSACSSSSASLVGIRTMSRIEQWGSSTRRTPDRASTRVRWESISTGYRGELSLSLGQSKHLSGVGVS